MDVRTCSWLGHMTTTQRITSTTFIYTTHARTHTRQVLPSPRSNVEYKALDRAVQRCRIPDMVIVWRHGDVIDDDDRLRDTLHCVAITRKVQTPLLRFVVQLVAQILICCGCVVQWTSLNNRSIIEVMEFGLSSAAHYDNKTQVHD